MRTRVDAHRWSDRDATEGRPMNYDRLGFPIPPEFVRPADSAARAAALPGRPRRGRPAQSAGRGKGCFLLGMLAAVVVPGLLAPASCPRSATRSCSGRWSGPSAREARGQLGRGDRRPRPRDPLGRRRRRAAAAACSAGGRCSGSRTATRAGRGRRRRGPPRSIPDGGAAAPRAGAGPRGARPGRRGARRRRRRRSTLRPGRPRGPQPPGLHPGPGGPRSRGGARRHRRRPRGAAPEAAGVLDTRGYVLHLLGRHHEAIDQLNLAIDGAAEDPPRARCCSRRPPTRDDSPRPAVARPRAGRDAPPPRAGLRGGRPREQARQDFEHWPTQKGFDP